MHQLKNAITLFADNKTPFVAGSQLFSLTCKYDSKKQIILNNNIHVMFINLNKVLWWKNIKSKHLYKKLRQRQFRKMHVKTENYVMTVQNLVSDIENQDEE